MLTLTVRAGLAPLALLAVTEIFPLPDAGTVTFIDVVVDVPLQPKGKVQV